MNRVSLESGDDKNGSLKQRVLDSTMATALLSVSRHGKSLASEAIVKSVKDKAALLRDPVKLKNHDRKGGSDYVWLRDLLIYLVARFLLVKSNMGGAVPIPTPVRKSRKRSKSK